MIDHEFVNLTQQPRILYVCTATGIAAIEVHLQGSASTELPRKKVSPRDVMQDARFRPEDVEAEKVVMQLCQPDETGGQKSLKSVLVGPFPLHDVHCLEEQVARNHQWKGTLGVQPDLVFVKKMMYTRSVGGNMEGKVPGKIYAWVVYVPSLNIDDNHAIMTIRELEAKAQQDATMDKMARSITGTAAPTNRGDTLAPSAGPSSSPMLRAIAVMKQTCGEPSNWKISDNYVSFDLQVDGAEVVVKNARIHTIAETLLGSFPNYRSTIPADARTTAQDIQSTLENFSKRGINVELGHFERSMMEGKPVVDVIPDPLDNEFIGLTTTKFGEFVHAIGNQLNHKENSWRMKAEAVDDLQTFVRENLAVNRESFCFLNAEILAGEKLKRLTTHEIWWKEPDAEKFEIPWTQLLNGNLGALPKDRRTLKGLLNELDRQGLYPLPQL